MPNSREARRILHSRRPPSGPLPPELLPPPPYCGSCLIAGIVSGHPKFNTEESVKIRSAVFSAIAVSLLLTTPAAPLEAQQLQLDQGPPAGELLRQIADVRTSRVRSNVVAVDWADEAFIIPAAGNAQGANNTYFRSDVTIINYRDTPQRVAVGWMPQGSNNCNAPTTIIELGTGWRFYSDFVGQLLQKNGVGALLFVAVDANGNADEDGELDGFSRIWTPQQNSNGTASQQFPAIDPEDLGSTIRAYIIGLRQDASFRTNVGVVNLDASPHTWDGQVYPAGAAPINFVLTAQPCALATTSIPAGNHGPLLVSFLQREPAAPWWTAYGSSTDNFTGDGWIVHATHGF